MIHSKKLLATAVMAATILLSCNSGETKKEDQPPTAAGASVLKEEPVSIQADSATMNCYLVYDDSIKNRRPAVLVTKDAIAMPSVGCGAPYGWPYPYGCAP